MELGDSPPSFFTLPKRYRRPGFSHKRFPVVDSATMKASEEGTTNPAGNLRRIQGSTF